MALRYMAGPWQVEWEQDQWGRILYVVGGSSEVTAPGNSAIIAAAPMMKQALEWYAFAEQLEATKLPQERQRLLNEWREDGGVTDREWPKTVGSILERARRFRDEALREAAGLSGPVVRVVHINCPRCNHTWAEHISGI